MIGSVGWWEARGRGSAGSMGVRDQGMVGFKGVVGV